MFKVRPKTQATSLVAEWAVDTEAPPRLKIVVPPRPAERVDLWTLGWFLGAFAAGWAFLVCVVAAFQTMLAETGLTPPLSIESLFHVSMFSRSPIGIALGCTLMAESIAALRWRPALRGALAGLTWLLTAMLVLAILVLFQPIIQITQKL